MTKTFSGIEIGGELDGQILTAREPRFVAVKHEPTKTNRGFVARVRRLWIDLGPLTVTTKGAAIYLHEVVHTNDGDVGFWRPHNWTPSGCIRHVFTRYKPYPQ